MDLMHNILILKFNGVFIRKILTLLLLTVFFIFSCSNPTSTTDNDSGSSTGGGLGSTSVSGNVTIPNTMNAVSSTGRAAGSGFSGNVQIIIGDVEILVDSSELEIDADYLHVPFTQDIDFSGLVVITFNSNLEYDGTPVEAVGTLMTVIEEESDNNINDRDGDGVVSSQEEVDAFEEISLSGETVTGPPVIDSFILSAETSTDPIVTFDASFSNVNIDLFTLRVNDSYRIDNLDLLGTGGTVYSQDLPLSPGDNEIQLIVINSEGVTFSAVQNVMYTRPGSSSTEGLLVTLDWDSPTSDMDLHTFYYDNLYPDDSSYSDWQNCYWDAMAPVSEEELAIFTGVSSYNISTGTTTYSGNMNNLRFDGFNSYLDFRDITEASSFGIDGLTFDLGNYNPGIYPVSGTGYINMYNSTNGDDLYEYISVTSGSITLTSTGTEYISGEITISGNIIDDTTYDILDSITLTQTFTSVINGESDSVLSVRKLDVDDTEGYGPEHFTLDSAADGYYAVAVKSYSLDADLVTNCYVTIETKIESRVFGPFNFTTSNESGFPVENSDSWYRVADIRIQNGQAEILSPGTSTVARSMSISGSVATSGYLNRINTIPMINQLLPKK